MAVKDVRPCKPRAVRISTKAGPFGSRAAAGKGHLTSERGKDNAMRSIFGKLPLTTLYIVVGPTHSLLFSLSPLASLLSLSLSLSLFSLFSFAKTRDLLRRSLALHHKRPLALRHKRSSCVAETPLPQKWSYPSVATCISCHCEDCRSMSAFFAGPTQQWVFHKTVKERAHLQDQLGRHRDPSKSTDYFGLFGLGAGGSRGNSSAKLQCSWKETSDTLTSKKGNPYTANHRLEITKASTDAYNGVVNKRQHSTKMVTLLEACQRKRNDTVCADQCEESPAKRNCNARVATREISRVATQRSLVSRHARSLVSQHRGSLVLRRKRSLALQHKRSSCVAA